MANLFSYHDPYRVHAFFGVCALLHMIYRLWNIYFYYSAFPAHESYATQTGSVLIHAALHASSFIPHIPKVGMLIFYPFNLYT